MHLMIVDRGQSIPRPSMYLTAVNISDVQYAPDDSRSWSINNSTMAVRMAYSSFFHNCKIINIIVTGFVVLPLVA